ncbi:hypothetical protein GUY40_21150 [Pseudomonas sp. R5(2019)]|nr:hypothetical protein [Pseudomonas sp. R5(2019)]
MLVLYGGWFASEHFGLSPYAVFAACVPLIALASWGSYVLIEKRLYRGIKGWLDSRRAVPVAVPLTRQNY